MTDVAAALRGFPALSFPFTVSAYRLDDPGAVAPIWSVTMDGPGVLKVPALGPTWIRARYPNGHEVDAWPPAAAS